MATERGGYHDGMVLAFDELQRTPLVRDDTHLCPDCFSDLRHEARPVPPDAESYRCTFCGAGWLTNAAGWLFPTEAA